MTKDNTKCNVKHFWTRKKHRFDLPARFFDRRHLRPWDSWNTPFLPYFDIFCPISHVRGILTSPDLLNMHREYNLPEKMVLVACFRLQIFNLKCSLYGTNEPNIYCIILYRCILHSFTLVLLSRIEVCTVEIWLKEMARDPSMGWFLP